jgi:hypothetical protein
LDCQWHLLCILCLIHDNWCTLYYFFFWLTRVNQGQLIWLVTRSLDQVDHRIGFQNYAKNPFTAALETLKKNRPLQSLQSSTQSRSIQPRPLPPPRNPRPIMLNKQLSWSPKVTIDLFEIVVALMFKSVFHLKIHQNKFFNFSKIIFNISTPK